MKYSSFLILIICMIFVSCKDNSTSSKENWLSLPLSLVVPQNTTIDGGMFLVNVGKFDNENDPVKLMTQVALPYTSWPGVIDVKLDNNDIDDFFKRLDVSPYNQHIWNVLADTNHSIPTINDTIPPVQPVDITSHSMNDSITKTGTITWSTPLSGSGTELAIIITRFKPNSSDTTGINIIPTADDGSYTFSSNDFASIAVGENAKVSVVRLKSIIKSKSSKNYIFSSMFTNNIILIIKQ